MVSHIKTTVIPAICDLGLIVTAHRRTMDTIHQVITNRGCECAQPLRDLSLTDQAQSGS